MQTFEGFMTTIEYYKVSHRSDFLPLIAQRKENNEDCCGYFIA